MNQSNSPEAIQQRIVLRIENLIRQLNSGQPFDWNLLDPLDWKLIEIWRDEEANQERGFRIKTNLIFEHLIRQSNK